MQTLKIFSIESRFFWARETLLSQDSYNFSIIVLNN